MAMQLYNAQTVVKDTISFTKTGFYFGREKIGKRVNILYDSDEKMVQFQESKNSGYKVQVVGHYSYLSVKSFSKSYLIPYGIYIKVKDGVYKLSEEF